MKRRGTSTGGLTVRCIAPLFAVFAMALAAQAQAAAARSTCGNEAYRAGLSAALPDCRAYELVSPSNTNGRRLSALNASNPFNLFPTEMGTESGQSFLFFTAGAPLEGLPGANGSYDQYEAVRASGGWITVRHLNPSGAQAVFPNAGGVSPDHQYAFYNVGPVNGGDGGALADEGEANYLASPDGSFELLGVGTLGVERLAEGRRIVAGGAHVIFTTGGPRCAGSCEAKQLEPQAPPTGTPAVYDRSADGQTRVVSLLPSGSPPAEGEASEYQGSSADGSVVAFKIGETLYVRINNAVSKEVATGGPIFGGLSADGSKLFFVLGGNIFTFDVASGLSTQINTSEDAQLVTVSDDGTDVYFVSPSQLDGPNGTPGEYNLYVWSASKPSASYIATVDPADLGGVPGLTNWTSHVVSPEGGGEAGPGASSARTNPDGSVLVFESRAKLTPYENSGHREIYRFDTADESLRCVSCGALSETPAFDARLEAVEAGLVNTYTIIHNLSGDGSRVFFETKEALVNQDTDGVNDIYEWHESTGESPTISLISSGQTPKYLNQFGTSLETNIIYAINSSAQDVFFGSVDALLPAAGSGGALALYDARVDGGVAEPVSQACIAEGCRQLTDEPAALLDARNSVDGKGNLMPKRHCRGPKRVAKHRRRGCRRRHGHHRSHNGHRKPTSTLGGAK